LKNLPYQIDESHIRDFFSSCGNINKVKLLKGKAFIGFDTKEGQNNAYKMDQHVLMGRSIGVGVAYAQSNEGGSRDYNRGSQGRYGNGGYQEYNSGQNSRFEDDNRFGGEGRGYGGDDRFGGGRGGGRGGYGGGRGGYGGGRGGYGDGGERGGPREPIPNEVTVRNISYDATQDDLQ